MKIQFLFKWYDLWIGFFYDKKKNWIYFLPLPMMGIIIKLPRKLNIPDVSNSVCKCPLCGEEMNGIELTHYKCKKCNEYFTN